MNVICPNCAICLRPCRPATNGIGWNIEEHHMPKGWAAIDTPSGTPYPCPHIANTELTRIPRDGVERRVYEALQAK